MLHGIWLWMALIPVSCDSVTYASCLQGCLGFVAPDLIVILLSQGLGEKVYPEGLAFLFNSQLVNVVTMMNNLLIE